MSKDCIKYISFDGENDYRVASHHTDFDFIDDRTVTFWFKCNPQIGSNQILFKGEYENDLHKYWGIGIEHSGSHTGKLIMSLADGGENYPDGIYFRSEISVTDDKWHNATITYSHSESTFRMYIDGTLDNAMQVDSSSSFSSGESSLTMSVGRNGTDGRYDNFYKGNLDEVMFYKRLLSPEVIKESIEPSCYKSIYSPSEELWKCLGGREENADGEVTGEIHSTTAECESYISEKTVEEGEELSEATPSVEPTPTPYGYSIWTVKSCGDNYGIFPPDTQWIAYVSKEDDDVEKIKVGNVYKTTRYHGEIISYDGIVYDIGSLKTKQIEVASNNSNATFSTQGQSLYDDIDNLWENFTTYIEVGAEEVDDCCDFAEAYFEASHPWFNSSSPSCNDSNIECPSYGSNYYHCDLVATPTPMVDPTSDCDRWQERTQYNCGEENSRECASGKKIFNSCHDNWDSDKNYKGRTLACSVSDVEDIYKGDIVCYNNMLFVARFNSYGQKPKFPYPDDWENKGSWGAIYFNDEDTTYSVIQASESGIKPDCCEESKTTLVEVTEPEPEEECQQCVSPDGCPEGGKKLKFKFEFVHKAARAGWQKLDERDPKGTKDATGKSAWGADFDIDRWLNHEYEDPKTNQKFCSIREQIANAFEFWSNCLCDWSNVIKTTDGVVPITVEMQMGTRGAGAAGAPGGTFGDRITKGYLFIDPWLLGGSTAQKRAEKAKTDFWMDRTYKSKDLTNFEFVIRHEVCHILGIGALWQNLPSNAGSPYPGNDYNFLIDDNAREFRRKDRISVPVGLTGDNEYRGPASPLETLGETAAALAALQKADPFYKAHTYLVDLIDVGRDTINSEDSFAVYDVKAADGTLIRRVHAYREYIIYKQGKLQNTDITIGDLVRNGPMEQETSPRSTPGNPLGLHRLGVNLDTYHLPPLRERSEIDSLNVLRNKNVLGFIESMKQVFGSPPGTGLAQDFHIKITVRKYNVSSPIIDPAFPKHSRGPSIFAAKKINRKAPPQRKDDDMNLHGGKLWVYGSRAVLEYRKWIKKQWNTIPDLKVAYSGVEPGKYNPKTGKLLPNSKELPYAVPVEDGEGQQKGWGSVLSHSRTLKGHLNLSDAKTGGIYCPPLGDTLLSSMTEISWAGVANTKQEPTGIALGYLSDLGYKINWDCLDDLGGCKAEKEIKDSEEETTDSGSLKVYEKTFAGSSTIKLTTGALKSLPIYPTLSGGEEKLQGDKKIEALRAVATKEYQQVLNEAFLTGPEGDIHGRSYLTVVKMEDVSVRDMYVWKAVPCPGQEHKYHKDLPPPPTQYFKTKNDYGGGIIKFRYATHFYRGICYNTFPNPDARHNTPNRRTVSASAVWVSCTHCIGGTGATEMVGEEISSPEEYHKFGLKGTYPSDAKQNDDGTYEMDLEYTGPELQMFTEDDGKIGFTDAGWVQVSLTKLGGPLDKDPKNCTIDPIYCVGDEFVLNAPVKKKYGWEDYTSGLEGWTTKEFTDKLLANPKIYQDWADQSKGKLSRTDFKKKVAESDALAAVFEGSFQQKYKWYKKTIDKCGLYDSNNWVDYNTTRNAKWGPFADCGEIYYMSKYEFKAKKLTPHKIDIAPYIKKMQASKRVYWERKKWIPDVDTMDNLRTAVMDMVHSSNVQWKWLTAIKKAFGLKKRAPVKNAMWNPGCDEEFVLNEIFEEGQLCYIKHDDTIELTEFGHPKENVSRCFETQCYSYVLEDIEDSKSCKVEDIDQFEESFYVALPSDIETEYKIESIDRESNTIRVSLGYDGENYKFLTASKDDRIDIVAKSDVMGDRAELEEEDCLVIEEEPPIVEEPEETTPTPTPTPTWGSSTSSSACCSEVAEEIVGTGSYPDTIHQVRRIKVKDPCHFEVGHYVAIEGIEQLALVTGKSSSSQTESYSSHSGSSGVTPTPSPDASDAPEEENYLIIGSGPPIGGSLFFDQTISVGAKICVVTLEENTCSDCYYNSAVKWTEDMWDAEHLQKDAYRLSDIGGEDCTCREEIYSTDCSEGRIPWDADGERCLNNGYCWNKWDPSVIYEGKHLCSDEEAIERAEQEGVVYKMEPLTKCTDYVCHDGFVWKAIVNRSFSGVEPTSKISKDVKHPSYWVKMPSMCCGSLNPEPTSTPEPPERDNLGACCYPDGSNVNFELLNCKDNVTQSNCENLGGQWYMNQSCSENDVDCLEEKKLPPPEDPWNESEEEAETSTLFSATHTGVLCETNESVFLALERDGSVTGKTLKINNKCVHDFERVIFKKTQLTDYRADNNTLIFDICDDCASNIDGNISTPLGSTGSKGEKWVTVEDPTIFTEGEEVVIGTGPLKSTKTISRIELNKTDGSLGALYFDTPLERSYGGGVLAYTSTYEASFLTKNINKGESLLFVHSTAPFSTEDELVINPGNSTCHRNKVTAVIDKAEARPPADVKEAPELMWGHARTQPPERVYIGTALFDRMTAPGYLEMETLLIDAMGIEDHFHGAGEQARAALIDRLRNHNSGPIWTMTKENFEAGFGNAEATCLRRHDLTFNTGFARIIKMTKENYFKNPLGSILMKRSLLDNMLLKDEDGNKLRKLDVTKLKEINTFQVAISNELAHQIQITMGAFIVNKGEQEISKNSGLAQFKDTAARKKWLRETNEKMMKKIGVTMPAFDKDYLENLGKNIHVRVFMSSKENQKRFGFANETTFMKIWHKVHAYAKKETKNPDANIFDIVRLGYMDAKTAWILVEYLIYVTKYNNRDGVDLIKKVDGKNVFDPDSKWSKDDPEGSTVHMLEIERMSHLSSMLIQIEQAKKDNKVLGDLKAAEEDDPEKDGECIMLEKPLQCSHEEGQSCYIGSSLLDGECSECPEVADGDDCDECPEAEKEDAEPTPTPTPTPSMECSMFGWKDNPNKDYKDHPYHWFQYTARWGMFDKRGKLLRPGNPWKGNYGGDKTKFKKGDYVCDGHASKGRGVQDDPTHEEKTHCYKCIKEFDIESILSSYEKDLRKLEKIFKAKYTSSKPRKDIVFVKDPKFLKIYHKYKNIIDEFRPVKREPAGEGWIPNNKYWEQSADCDDCAPCKHSYKRILVDDPKYPECPDCADECDAKTPFKIKLIFDLPEKEDPKDSSRKVLTESAKKIKAQAEWAAKVWENCICDFSSNLQDGGNEVIIGIGTVKGDLDVYASADGHRRDLQLYKKGGGHGEFDVNTEHINGHGNKVEDTIAYSNPHGDEITLLQEIILHELGHILGIVTNVSTEEASSFQATIGAGRNFLIDDNAKEFTAKYHVQDKIHTYGRDRGSVSPWEIGKANSDLNDGKWWNYYKKSNPFYKADSYFLGKSEVLGAAAGWSELFPWLTAAEVSSGDAFRSMGEMPLGIDHDPEDETLYEKGDYAVYKIRTPRLPEIDFQGIKFSKIGIGDLVRINKGRSGKIIVGKEDKPGLDWSTIKDDFFEPSVTHKSLDTKSYDSFGPLRNPDVLGYVEKIENGVEGTVEYTEIVIVKYNAPEKKHSKVTAVEKIKKGQELYFYGSKAVIEFKKWHILNSPKADVSNLPYAIPLYHKPTLDKDAKGKLVTPKDVGGSRMWHWSEDNVRTLHQSSNCEDIGTCREDILCLPMGLTLMSPMVTKDVAEPLTSIELGMLTDLGIKINWGCVKNIPKWVPPEVDECSRCDEVCIDAEDEDCYLSDEYGSPEECRERTFDCENYMTPTPTRLKSTDTKKGKVNLRYSYSYRLDDINTWHMTNRHCDEIIDDPEIELEEPLYKDQELPLHQVLGNRTDYRTSLYAWRTVKDTYIKWLKGIGCSSTLVVVGFKNEKMACYNPASGQHEQAAEMLKEGVTLSPSEGIIEVEAEQHFDKAIMVGVLGTGREVENVEEQAAWLAGDGEEKIFYYDDSDGKGPEGKRLYEDPDDEFPIIIDPHDHEEGDWGPFRHDLPVKTNPCNIGPLKSLHYNLLELEQLPIGQPVGIQRQNIVFVFGIPNFLKQSPKLTKYAGNYFAMGFDNDHGEPEWRPGAAKQYDRNDELINEGGWLKYTDNTKIPTLGEVCVESEIILGPCDYTSYVDGGFMAEMATEDSIVWGDGDWKRDESESELDRWIETYGEHVKIGWNWASRDPRKAEWDEEFKQCLSCNGFKFIEESEEEGYHTIVDPSQLLPIPNARDLVPDGDYQHAPDGGWGYGQIAWDTAADPFTHDGYGPLDENGWTKWTVYEPDFGLGTSLRVPAFMIQFNLNHPGTIQLTTGSCEGAEIDGNATNVDTYMCLSRVEDGLSISEDGDSCEEGGNDLNAFIEAHLEAKSYICADSSDGVWDKYSNPYLFKFGFHPGGGPFSSACSAYRVLITGQTKEDRGSFKFAYRFKPDPENLCMDQETGITRYTDDPSWYTGAGVGVCTAPTPTPTQTPTSTPTPDLGCVDYYGDPCNPGDEDCVCPQPTPTPSFNTPTPSPDMSEPSQPTPTPTRSLDTPTPTLTRSLDTPTPTLTRSLDTPTPTLTPTRSLDTPTPTLTPTPSPSMSTPTPTLTPTRSLDTPTPTLTPTVTTLPQERWIAYDCESGHEIVILNGTGVDIFNAGNIVCTDVGCMTLVDKYEYADGYYQATISEATYWTSCEDCWEYSEFCNIVYDPSDPSDPGAGGGETVESTEVFTTPTPSANTPTPSANTPT